MNWEQKTLPNLLQQVWSDRDANEVLVATKRSGAWFKCRTAEFMQRVRHISIGLYQMGVRPGDRVTLHSRNSTEWLVCDLAILHLGAVTVPIYTTQPGSQIEHILRDSGTTLHIVENDELFAETKPLVKSISTLKKIVCVEPSSHASLQSIEELQQSGEDAEPGVSEEVEALKGQITPESLATIIYTSGTTGMPKGVMLSHGNLAYTIQAAMERVPFELAAVRGKPFLSYLPLSHVFERVISYMYLLMGVNIWYVEAIDEIREDLKEVRPAFFATVPRLLEKLQNGMKARGQEMHGASKGIYYWALRLASRYDPSRPGSLLERTQRALADRLVYQKIRAQLGGELIGFVSGGAPLSEEIFRFINGIGLYCGQGYGLTETSPVIAAQDRTHLKPGSCGLPLRGVDVRIAEDGEICVKGPNVMMGYYNDEEQTREMFDTEGWLLTGDIGELDSDGELYVKDRKKDLFKLSTGKFVAPQYVETQLVNSPFIEQAVVVGYQQKFCGALIVPATKSIVQRLQRRGTDSVEPTLEEVRKVVQEEIDKVNRNLSPWETVKRFVILEEPLTIEGGELTPTLKVKRNVVKERFQEQIQQIYADQEVE